jgi:hypothetical protein
MDRVRGSGSGVSSAARSSYCAVVMKQTNKNLVTFFYSLFLLFHHILLHFPRHDKNTHTQEEGEEEEEEDVDTKMGFVIQALESGV